jgi:predicted RNase H-like nuclease (RuvC/YqgF family)
VYYSIGGVMTDNNAKEKTQLSTEELVNIANGQNAQIKQMDSMIKDLSTKIANVEVQNSQLKAIIETLVPKQKQADDVVTEEE